MAFVNHVEFEVTNLKRAAKFYRSVLGFRVRIMPKMNYAMWQAEKGTGGGFSKVKHVKHGSTTAVFHVKDIDSHLMKAKKMGGRVRQKKGPLPGGMGYYAAFRDPFGNLIGLWSSH